MNKGTITFLLLTALLFGLCSCARKIPDLPDTPDVLAPSDIPDTPSEPKEESNQQFIRIGFPELSDVGVDPYNIRQNYAMADLVIKCKITALDMRNYTQKLVDHIPFTVTVEDVYKGDPALKDTTLTVAHGGGIIPLQDYIDYVQPVWGGSPEKEEIVLNMGGLVNVPIVGNTYVMFLNSISEKTLQSISEQGATYRHRSLGMFLGLYEVKNGNIYVGTHVGQEPFEEADEFLDHITDKEWLTYVERPAFAKEITYIPPNTEISMKASQSGENYYYICYAMPKNEEFPYGIGYHIWQAPADDEKSIDYYADLVEYGTCEIIAIRGIKMKYYELEMGNTPAKILYFVHDGIEYNIEVLCAPDTTELIKIAESFIN